MPSPRWQCSVEQVQRFAGGFLANSTPRKNRKGQDVTDPESTKMATSKGVIQGYAAQAAVDSAHQVTVATDVIDSGSEQGMLRPMIAQSHPL